MVVASTVWLKAVNVVAVDNDPFDPNSMFVICIIMLVVSLDCDAMLKSLVDRVVEESVMVVLGNSENGFVGSSDVDSISEKNYF